MHCDNVIHRRNYPICLRFYILVNRLPVLDKYVIHDAVGEPKCFATWEGQRVRLVMASRMGDVGITTQLENDHGYEHRVTIDQLSDFSSEV